MAEYGPDAPIEEDIRFDDVSYNPTLEPDKSDAWLNLLKESEKAFDDWNARCDNIDKMYANIARLVMKARDKEFQMLWANNEVLKPSIYAKPPIPVVVTKFKDRRPVPQAASELLERTATVSFDLAHINDLMLQVRDDVALYGRGVPWCRYESGGTKGYYSHEKVCIDHKQRRDFLHSVSRCWYEVWWVAAASYLTRDEARERFQEYSGDEYQDADYQVDRDAKEVGGADDRERAKFWEIWDRKNERCVWVAEGCENILDESDPEIEFCDFFPCPCPAYGTLQPGSLVPVPDSLQYKDQLEELNTLTGKIHALAEALEAKGFYPAGGGEMADAIQTALAIKTPGRVLVPINNWAAFGGTKEIIVWMPIDVIATTIQQLVALRRQIIEDIYQIMGLSDIMRGATDPTETLGAQQLKTQYGGTRIRDKQQQLVRVARDLVQISTDIICDKFKDTTIIQMSQTDLPTKRMVEQNVAALTQDLAKQQQAIQMAQQTPQYQQMAQQQPEQIQQITVQAQQLIETSQNAIAKLQAKPTFEQVMTFLRDNRARAFVLDIETDSTILVDENAEKQRRSEFMGVLAQLLPQLTAMIASEPATAEFCGEALKFFVAPYRAGRGLDSAIDNLVDLMQQKATQQRGDDPQTMAIKSQEKIETQKVQVQREKIENDKNIEMIKIRQKDDHDKARLAQERDIKVAELRGGEREDQAKADQANLKMMQERQKAQVNSLKAAQDMRVNQQKMDLAHQQSQLKAADMNARQQERQAAQAFRQQQVAMRPMPGAGRPM